MDLVLFGDLVLGLCSFLYFAYFKGIVEVNRGFTVDYLMKFFQINVLVAAIPFLIFVRWP